MLNERFITYFSDTFFSDNDEELEQFLGAIVKPILRSIRIKPEKIKQVTDNLQNDGWILNPTNINNVFTMDRREDFDPLERRLGFSSDHLLGNFYIQELAAAHPVDILADSQINTESFLILDMAASPGGKTTQLVEYFPNSFIIANEPTRERLPQLLQNLERMGSVNIGITLYPWQLYKNHEEIFDRILLDAPCSGEWTLFKGTDAVKHWHIKNIKEIARLQTKLLDAGLNAIKIWWEMVYSTCSLNLLENEWVLDTMKTKYGNAIEILFQKKFWPHIDGTGGFFVAKIRKLQSLKIVEFKESTENRWKKPESKFQITSNKELRVFRGNISPWNIQEGITLYEHEWKILAIKNNNTGSSIIDKLFLMRYGEQIWTVEHGKFIPWNRAWRYLQVNSVHTHTISSIEELDTYLRGEPIVNTGNDESIVITYNNQILWLEYRKWCLISNTFSHEWRRK